MASFFEITQSRCEKLESVSYLNLALSIVLLIGILISYLPQHYRIIARGTSEGISPWYILLGTTASNSAFANILIQPTSRADVACCKTVGTFECVAGLLGIAQVGVMWFCFCIITVLFLIFFPRGPSLPTSTDKTQASWRTAIIVGFLSLVHGLAVIVVTGVLGIWRPNYMANWANLLGLMAACLSLPQYLPQIWTTYTLKHVGSLSIPTMLVQTPGSYLWAASLAARLGPEGWSTWGLYLITGTLQGVLLVMGIYYESKARRAAAEGSTTSASTSPDSTERTPLLNGSANNQ